MSASFEEKLLNRKTTIVAHEVTTNAEGGAKTTTKSRDGKPF